MEDCAYNDTLWIQNVQREIKKYNLKDSEIVILGFEKDESSWYLRAFPNWEFKELDGYVNYGEHPIDATKIRELYFEGLTDYITGVIPPQVFDYLNKFSSTEIYKTLVEEHKFIKNYKESWKAALYAPTFVTVDSVVIQGGHILLVKRKFRPGQGLWALPGGFLNQNETTRQACIRELREETGIKIPVPVLNGSITYEKLFDKPDRSLRGRTLTHAFLIELSGPDSKLPKIKANDDAAETRFFSLNEINNMRDQLFEDHFDIISYMVGRTK